MIIEYFIISLDRSKLWYNILKVHVYELLWLSCYFPSLFQLTYDDDDDGDDDNDDDDDWVMMMMTRVMMMMMIFDSHYGASDCYSCLLIFQVVPWSDVPPKCSKMPYKMIWWCLSLKSIIIFLDTHHALYWIKYCFVKDWLYFETW